MSFPWLHCSCLSINLKLLVNRNLPDMKLHIFLLLYPLFFVLYFPEGEAEIKCWETSFSVKGQRVINSLPYLFWFEYSECTDDVNSKWQEKTSGRGNLFCGSDVCCLHICFISCDFMGGFELMGFLLYSGSDSCFHVITPVCKKKLFPFWDERVSFSQLLSMHATPSAETSESECSVRMDWSSSLQTGFGVIWKDQKSSFWSENSINSHKFQRVLTPIWIMIVPWITWVYWISNDLFPLKFPDYMKLIMICCLLDS